MFVSSCFTYMRCSKHLLDLDTVHDGIVSYSFPAAETVHEVPIFVYERVIPVHQRHRYAAGFKHHRICLPVPRLRFFFFRGFSCCFPVFLFFVLAVVSGFRFLRFFQSSTLVFCVSSTFGSGIFLAKGSLYWILIIPNIQRVE